RQAQDPGHDRVLQQYQTERYWDNLGMILLTDTTNRLFSNQIGWCQFIRRIGLRLLQVRPFKQVLMYFMMGLHCHR
ncbi:MAG: ubiquinone biosynthesis protein, partial [Cyanobacteria bacterium KgW148]|nr:ubiquinone biosynthesis protein [Cyanobacteria bacterium KgW148]